MKILITGGTGFVGSALTARLLELGHEVTVIGSSSTCRLAGHANLKYISADTTKPGDWQRRVADQDALINLTGRTVFHLWTESYKKSIHDSRILTTRNLVAALPERTEVVLLSTSAAGYYGDGGEAEKTETSACGSDFLARVCRDWEAEADKAAVKGARVVLHALRRGARQGRRRHGDHEAPVSAGTWRPDRQRQPVVSLDPPRRPHRRDPLSAHRRGVPAAPSTLPPRRRCGRRTLPGSWARPCTGRPSCRRRPLSCGWSWASSAPPCSRARRSCPGP